jgi:L-xylulokinase
MGINIAAVDEKTILPPVKNFGEWFTFAGMSRGQRAITSSIGSGCNSINWFLNMFFRDIVMEVERTGISVFTYLEQLLSGQKPTNVIFQPYLLGTFYNSSAKAGFLGITSQTSREELLLAMFQGVCISMCIEIKRLETVLETFHDICIVGGGSNSTIWSQMFADVLDRPVRVCTTSEVGCRGAAICAAVALGFIKGMKDIAPPEQKHEYLPRPEMHAVYMEQYEIYSKLNESCTMMWEKQNKLNENSVKLPERNDKIKGELPC